MQRWTPEAKALVIKMLIGPDVFIWDHQFKFKLDNNEVMINFENANWLAQDADGEWYTYVGEPYVSSRHEEFIASKWIRVGMSEVAGMWPGEPMYIGGPDGYEGD